MYLCCFDLLRDIRTSRAAPSQLKTNETLSFTESFPLLSILWKGFSFAVSCQKKSLFWYLKLLWITYTWEKAWIWFSRENFESKHDVGKYDLENISIIVKHCQNQGPDLFLYYNFGFPNTLHSTQTPSTQRSTVSHMLPSTKHTYTPQKIHSLNPKLFWAFHYIAS